MSDIKTIDDLLEYFIKEVYSANITAEVAPEQLEFEFCRGMIRAYENAYEKIKELKSNMTYDYYKYALMLSFIGSAAKGLLNQYQFHDPYYFQNAAKKIMEKLNEK